MNETKPYIVLAESKSDPLLFLAGLCHEKDARITELEAKLKDAETVSKDDREELLASQERYGEECRRVDGLLYRIQLMKNLIDTANEIARRTP